MRYVSTFSGVEAATVAWEPLGWEPLAFCEIDAFPSAVLAERFPEVPNLGDIREVDWRKYRGKADLVVGGSPCQSFSVAGKREGLKGESGLMLEFVRAIREVRPRWLLWENVPGALSSEHGEAFRCLLSSLDELGYGLAWRVLDAQFFGVAQRRRRLFVVGHLGDMRAADVLLEPDCLRGDHPSSRGKRQELARAAGLRAGGDGLWGIGGNVVGRADGNGGHHLGVVDPDENGMFSLTATDRHAVAFAANQRGEVRLQGGDGGVFGAIPTAWSGKQAQGVVCLADDNAKAAADVDLCGSLKVGGAPPTVGTRWEVRRLTPRECERLQGFPDDWTRYKAIGNSMAVPVMRWIGGRIAAVEDESKR